MTTLSRSDWRRVEAAFDRFGLLVGQHRRLPSVVSLVVGEAIRGSWLAHPRCHAIHAALTRLRESPGILTVRLVDRHVTFVHPRLVPAVRAVATSGERWQTEGLSMEARRLRTRLSRHQELRTDDEGDVVRRRSVAKAASELESRLLLRSEEIHSEDGHHARVLRWWVPPSSEEPHANAARRTLEEAVSALAGGEAFVGDLPWQSRRRARRG